MGPFPHDAPKATISPKNPAGTDGFEFVEFAHSDPDVLRDLFSKMGFTLCARHKVKDIELWQHGMSHILSMPKRTVLQTVFQKLTALVPRPWLGVLSMQSTHCAMLLKMVRPHMRETESV